VVITIIILFHVAQVLQILQRLYRNVEDIDLYVGGITERRSSGALLGHTFLCLVGDQFARLKKGDRFFYDLQNQPSSFTIGTIELIYVKVCSELIMFLRSTE